MAYRIEQSVGYQMYTAAAHAVASIDKAIDALNRQPSVIAWLRHVPLLRIKRRRFAAIAAAYDHYKE